MFHSDCGHSAVVRVQGISIGPSSAIEMDKAPCYGNGIVVDKSMIHGSIIPGHLLSEGRLSPCAVSAALRAGEGQIYGVTWKGWLCFTNWRTGRQLDLECTIDQPVELGSNESVEVGLSPSRAVVLYCICIHGDSASRQRTAESYFEAKSMHDALADIALNLK